MDMAKRSSRIVLIGGAAALALAGCTDPATLNGQTTNQDRGVAVGAAVGALAGNLLANNRTAGAIVGAGIGATVGGLVGYNLDQQEAELRGQLDSRIQIVNAGDRLIVTMPQGITFETDSSAVSQGIQDDLQAVARSLQQYPQSTIQVIGHTDNVGSPTYNLGLSEERARAVANLLAAYGTPANRMTTVARGEEQPIASNLTPEGRAQNRRVEIVIIPNKA